MFDSILLGVLYSLGTFLIVSIAYSIVYSMSDNKKEKRTYNHPWIQLAVIGGGIVLNFLILSSQFSKSSLLYTISEPIRIFFFENVGTLGLSQEINSIIVNNLTAVIIPSTILIFFTQNIKQLTIRKREIKILGLLFLLYLPIILFGGKSIEKILTELPIYLFIAAIPEEVLFRGLLQSRLQSLCLKPINAILLASLVFGLMHLPINMKLYGNWLGLATCIGNNAFGGLLIGYLFYKTRSLSVVIIFHVISGIALT